MNSATGSPATAAPPSISCASRAPTVTPAASPAPPKIWETSTTISERRYSAVRASAESTNDSASWCWTHDAPSGAITFRSAGPEIPSIDGLVVLLPDVPLPGGRASADPAYPLTTVEGGSEPVAGLELGIGVDDDPLTGAPLDHVDERTDLVEEHRAGRWVGAVAEELEVYRGRHRPRGGSVEDASEVLGLGSAGGAEAEVVVPTHAQAGRPGSPSAGLEQRIGEAAALGRLQVGELDPVPAYPLPVDLDPGGGRRRHRGPGGRAVSASVLRVESWSWRGSPSVRGTRTVRRSSRTSNGTARRPPGRHRRPTSGARPAAVARGELGARSETRASAGARCR